MASSERQVRELLDLLAHRTESSGMRWLRSAEPGKYQSRVGDFVVNIGPSSTGIMTRGPVTLTVHRLDGTMVEVISESATGIGLGAMTRVPVSHFGKLGSIYELISGSNGDMDELLKLLR